MCVLDAKHTGSESKNVSVSDNHIWAFPTEFPRKCCLWLILTLLTGEHLQKELSTVGSTLDYKYKFYTEM